MLCWITGHLWLCVVCVVLDYGVSCVCCVELQSTSGCNNVSCFFSVGLQNAVKEQNETAANNGSTNTSENSEGTVSSHHYVFVLLFFLVEMLHDLFDLFHLSNTTTNQEKKSETKLTADVLKEDKNTQKLTKPFLTCYVFQSTDCKDNEQS